MPSLRVSGIAGADEGEQAVVIGLLIVLDQGVVVALGALHVAAEEDSADVARDQVGLGAAIEKEPRGGPELGVGTVGAQELAHHLIEGTIRLRGGEQVALPQIGRDIHARPAFHEHDVERGRPVAGEERACEQAVDLPGPLVGRLIGEKRFQLVDGRRHAGEVERNAPQELGVGRQRRGGPDPGRFDQPVDAAMQRLGRDRPRRYELSKTTSATSSPWTHDRRGGENRSWESLERCPGGGAGVMQPSLGPRGLGVPAGWSIPCVQQEYNKRQTSGKPHARQDATGNVLRYKFQNQSAGFGCGERELEPNTYVGGNIRCISFLAGNARTAGTNGMASGGGWLVDGLIFAMDLPTGVMCVRDARSRSMSLGSQVGVGGWRWVSQNASELTQSPLDFTACELGVRVNAQSLDVIARSPLLFQACEKVSSILAATRSRYVPVVIDIGTLVCPGCSEAMKEPRGHADFLVCPQCESPSAVSVSEEHAGTILVDYRPLEADDVPGVIRHLERLSEPIEFLSAKRVMAVPAVECGEPLWDRQLDG